MNANALLKRIRKNIGCESFSTSKLCLIDHFISTGIPALNRIMTGSIYRGVPSGRITIMAGVSQSGKTRVAAQTASHALTDNKYDVIFYGDSEGGGMKSMFESAGCDSSKIEHVPLENVEDATVKLLNILNEIKGERLAYNEKMSPKFERLEELKEKLAKGGKRAEGVDIEISDLQSEIDTEPVFKALILVDSLGALVPNKMYNDADKGKQVSDMGSRARLINNMTKACTMPALISNTPIIFINHTYANPAEMYAGKINNQSGGQGLQLMSSITVQCDKKQEKAEDTKLDTYYKGSFLRFFTTKNRIIKPFYETEAFIDFSRGVHKYEGLLEAAIKYGFILDNTVKNGYYLVPSWSDSDLIRKDDIYLDEFSAAWETFINKMDEKSIADMSYSNAAEQAAANAMIDQEEAKVMTDSISTQHPDETLKSDTVGGLIPSI